mmetsp:Transcript_89534/g.253663  ORF Transcript_89534/g.253663 Transcript_89534/m.253663 type:complete len:710 (-) Transcript_89534:25-2154(-)
MASARVMVLAWVWAVPFVRLTTAMQITLGEGRGTVLATPQRSLGLSSDGKGWKQMLTLYRTVNRTTRGFNRTFMPHRSDVRNATNAPVAGRCVMLRTFLPNTAFTKESDPFCCLESDTFYVAVGTSEYCASVGLGGGWMVFNQDGVRVDWPWFCELDKNADNFALYRSFIADTWCSTSSSQTTTTTTTLSTTAITLHCLTQCAMCPNGWPGACGWHRLNCGACWECQSVTPASVGKCANFCFHHAKGWLSACAIPSGDCKGCPPCRVHITTHGLPCKAFCTGVRNGWAGACGWHWKNCGGCSPCQNINPPSEPACANFCMDHPSGLASVCTIGSGNCSGCWQCRQNITPTGKCTNFCGSGILKSGWGSACGWRQRMCGGCSECSMANPAVNCSAFCTASPWPRSCNSRACSGCAPCQTSTAEGDTAPCASYCADLPSGWKGGCKHRPAKCGGCAACQPKLTTGDTAPCHKFCELLPNGWDGACTQVHDYCGGCYLCQSVYANAQKPCREFCAGVDGGWGVACGLTSCMGCNECESNVGTLALERPCQSSCQSMNWETACSWHGSECSGCDPCRPRNDTLPAGSMALTSQRCNKFCAMHSRGWPDACLWHSEECGGCEPCKLTSDSSEERPCANFCLVESGGFRIACNWHEELCSGCDACQEVVSKDGRSCMKFCSTVPNACDAYGQTCGGCEVCEIDIVPPTWAKNETD